MRVDLLKLESADFGFPENRPVFAGFAGLFSSSAAQSAAQANGKTFARRLEFRVGHVTIDGREPASIVPRSVRSFVLPGF